MAGRAGDAGGGAVSIAFLICIAGAAVSKGDNSRTWALLAIAFAIVQGQNP